MTADSKNIYIIGNWKMHKTIAEARAFITSLSLIPRPTHVHRSLAVPYTLIASAAEAAHGTGIAIGAQNISEHKSGPYTGEVSADQVQDAGASFTLIGHSESRKYHAETDLMIHGKIQLALDAGLKVVLCIGESAAERAGDRTEVTIERQLDLALKDVTALQFENITIAYEPLWAIGTGIAATPQQAQHVHAFIRAYISKKWGAPVGIAITILYGGSVSPLTAPGLLVGDDINGFLVGGASLDLDKFINIVS